MTCLCLLSVKVLRSMWIQEPDDSPKRKILIQIEPLILKYPKGGNEFIRELDALVSDLDTQNKVHQTIIPSAQYRVPQTYHALTILRDIVERYSNCSTPIQESASSFRS